MRDKILSAGLPAEDLDVIVAGLQSLWRERVRAWKVAMDMATRNGRLAPDQEAFGVGEAAQLLRRLGAAPQPD